MAPKHTDVEQQIERSVERSSLQQKLSLALLALGLLSPVVNFFLTREISTTASKIETTNQTLNKLSETVSIQQVKSDFQAERLAALENAREKAAETHKAMEQRLASLEQRQALFDQFMQAQKYR